MRSSHELCRSLRYLVAQNRQIKLHGPSGFAGMRKAGALVAKCLDELTDIVKPGVPTSRSTILSETSPSATAPTQPR